MVITNDISTVQILHDALYKLVYLITERVIKVRSKLWRVGWRCSNEGGQCKYVLTKLHNGKLVLIEITSACRMELKCCK